ncbi:MAG: hypothetical protein L0346_00650 [Chloroflexi bacterium]|nr:hypothetical protein [Chloroflexota bacterium]
MKSLVACITLLVILVLAACSGTTATQAGNSGESAVPASAGVLTEAYDDALVIRNQLLLGTLRLEGTPEAITPEQAAQLVPLWQAMKSLTTSGTAADEEIVALQDQIIDILTPEQAQAIAAMRLTQADLQAYYVEIGASTPSTSSADTADLSKEDRQATKVALGTPVGVSSGKSAILLDNVIELLKDKAA